MDPIIGMTIAAGVGLLIGGGLAYLLVDRRMRRQLNDAETSLAVIEQQHADNTRLLVLEKTLSEKLRSHLGVRERQLSRRPLSFVPPNKT